MFTPRLSVRARIATAVAKVTSNLLGEGSVHRLRPSPACVEPLEKRLLMITGSPIILLPNTTSNLVVVNDYDLEKDGVPDLADGFNRDGVTGNADDSAASAFLPVSFTLPGSTDLNSATLTVSYSGSDPALGVPNTPDVSAGYAPAAGSLRLWTTNGTLARTSRSIQSRDLNNPADNSIGFYVPGTLSGAVYSGSDLTKLGLTQAGQSKTLYVEAVRPSAAYGDLPLTITVDPDGPSGPTAPQTVLSIPITAVQSRPGVFNDPTSDSPGGTATGADAGNPATDSYSGLVRYADGTVNYTSSDLDPAEPGILSGHTRTWSNDLARVTDGTQGNGCTVAQWPTLVLGGNKTLMEVRGGESARWFDWSVGTTTRDRFGGTSLFTAPSTNTLVGKLQDYTLTDSLGDKEYFFSFTNFNIPDAQKGKLHYFDDPDGNRTTLTYSSSGQLQKAERARKLDGAILERLTYAYNGDGTLAGVSVDRLSAGALVNVRDVSLDYYDGTTSFGRAGDLERVTVSQAGTPVDRNLYRYDSAGRLTVALEGRSYALLTAALGGDPDAPLSADDSTVHPYADYVLTYFDASDPAKAGKVQTQAIQGVGTFQYDYTLNTDKYGVNVFKTKTIETLPDGTRNIVFANSFGEVVASEHDDGTLQWGKANRFDALGRRTLSAEPSAVQSFDENTPGAAVLYTGTGLIHFLQYYQNSTDPGAAYGYLQSETIQAGTNSPAVNYAILEQFAYSKRPSANAYVISTDTVYAGASGQQPIATTFVYAYFSGTNQVQTRTTTLPAVGTAQNGDDSAPPATVTEQFDPFGRIAGRTDADGKNNIWAYDDATGALQTAIVDAGGLALTTHTTTDVLGRPITITDPASRQTTMAYVDTADVREVRTTPPDVAGSPLPVQVVRDDRANGYEDTFTVVSGGTAVLSLTRSALDLNGRTIWFDRYADTSGATYEASVGNVPGTFVLGSGSRYRTQFGYDAMGRQDRVAADGAAYGSADGPLLQIARTAFDGLGRVSSVWTGTDDSDWISATSPGANLVKVSENQYDNAGAGDGNLTQVTQFPGSSPNRVTLTRYDWRDRPILTEAGVGMSSAPITALTYDNRGNVTASKTYDGTGVDISTIADPTNPDAALPGLLRAYTQTFFDNRGRAYRTLQHDISQQDGSDTGTLATDTWFDNRDDVIKVKAPGGLVTKTEYDGAGRATKQSLTDGGAATGTPDSTWADATNVTGDIVLQQVVPSYDPDGNVILTVTKQRYHDYTGTGDLGLGNARISVVGDWYDQAGRLITSVNWGNNGDDAQSFLIAGQYVRPDSPPDRDTAATNGFDQWLRTDYAYDASGNQALTESPRINPDDPANSADLHHGIKTRTYFDALGRKLGVTEAYTGSLGNMSQFLDPLPGKDTDRQTSYTYNGFDNVTKQTSITYDPSHTSTPRVLNTTYTYGVAKGANIAIDSNTLLSQVSYDISPDDPGSNLPSLTLTAGSDTEQVTGYDALGEVIQKVNRDGTTHDFAYDALGRQTSDHWSATASFSNGFISGADTRQVAYDALGRGVKFTMLSASTVLNEVARTYDGLGNMIAEYQAHDGAVSNTNGTIRSGVPVVGYTFDTNFTNNYSRLAQTVYPNGRIVGYSYGYDTFPLGGSSTGTFIANLNNAISRVGYVHDGATPSGSTELEDYDYLGLSQIVTIDRPNSPGFIRQSVITSDPNGTGALGATIAQGLFGFARVDDAGSGDPYDGLDRFGRIVDTGAGMKEAQRIYGYDADGNTLFARVGTNQIDETWKSEVYHVNGNEPDPSYVAWSAYDKLGRLKGYYRGVMDPSQEYVNQSGVNIVQVGSYSEPVPAQYLSADLWDTTSSGNFGQTQSDPSDLVRSNIYQKDVPTQEFTVTPASSGNPRDMFLKFDAWGQLAQQSQAYLFYDAATGKYYYDKVFQSQFQIDALGRRVSETTTNRLGTVETLDLYYDADGNIIQESHSTPGNAPTTRTQYIWSPVAKGHMIVRDDDSDDSTATSNYGVAGSGLDERVFPFQAPDGSTLQILYQDPSNPRFIQPSSIESYVYTPSGQVTIIIYDGYVGHDDYKFNINSEYDWRFLWHGGRAGHDQAVNNGQDPHDDPSYIDLFDGTLLMPGGVVYDTGSQAPLQQDKYAFFRPGGGSSDIHQYEYGQRSFVNVNYGYNGTGMMWQNLQEQMLIAKLEGAFMPMLTFGASFVSNVYGEVAGGLKELAYRAIDDGNDVLYLQSGGLLGSSNQNLSQVSQMQASNETTTLRATASAIPGMGLYEAASGEDVLTGQSISGADRWARGFAGISDVSGIAAGGLEMFGGQSGLSTLERESLRAPAATQPGLFDAGQVGLIDRLKLRWRYRDLIRQLKSGDVPMGDLAIPRTKQGVFGLMGDVTAATDREVALLRTTTGPEGLVLRLGRQKTVQLTGASRVLAHTHPSGMLGWSPWDYLSIFRKRGQQSSISVGPTGAWRRYTSAQGILGGNV